MREVTGHAGFGGTVAERFTHRDDIDGLRAIAIAPVLIFHAFPGVLPGGFLGVDVFFVISGFLIASLIFAEREAGTFSLAGFYRRRIRRIFPALAVVLAACLAVGYRGLFDAEFLQLARHALTGAFGLANLSLYRDTGYFSLPAETNPMLHLWSLGVEEQFYLLLPATILLVTRRALVWVLLAAFLGSLALLVAPGFSDNARFYLPQFRVWELLAGVLLAYLVHHGWRAPDRVREALPAAGLVLLLVAFVVATAKTAPIVSEGAAVLGTLAIIAAGPSARVNRILLASRPLVLLGLISYSLYLWHWPLLAFGSIIRPDHGPWFRLGAVAAAVVLAAITYVLIEQPARKRKTPAWALAAGMACVAVLAGLVVHANGRAGWAKDMGEMNPLGANDPACWRKFWGVDDRAVIVECSSLTEKPTVAIIGDSHAHHLYDGVKDYYAARGQHVVSLSTTGCTPFPEPASESDKCATARKRVLDKLDELGSIKTVVVSEYVTFMESGTRPTWILNARTMFWRFAARNWKTVLVLDIPPMPTNPRVACQYRPLPFARMPEDFDKRCSISRADYEKRVPAYRHMAKQAVAEIPGARFFDLPAHLCSKESCPAVINGRVIYLDDNHLNPWGSRYAARFYDWEP